MQAVNADRISRNAYRILGLPGTATQEAIDAAARKMRIWPDPQRIPPTPFDLPWLGPLPRTKNDLEQAVSRLNEPLTRVEERLMWFHAAHESLRNMSPELLDQTAQKLAATRTPAAVHDAALARYKAALALDPNLSDADRWQRTLSTFRKLADSPVYLQYLLDVENNGDFEKRATADEILSSLTELPISLVAGLASRAEAALDDGNLKSGLAMARLLRDIDKPASMRLLDRVEDLADRRCNEIEETLRRGIVFASDAHRSANGAICRRVATIYDDSIRPLLAELDGLGPDHLHRAQRVRWACARALSMLGTGWIAAGHFITAEQTFQLAQSFAAGTSLADKIQEQIVENAPRAEYQRRAQGISSPRPVIPIAQGAVTPTGRRAVPPPPPGQRQQQLQPGQYLIPAPPPYRKPAANHALRWSWLAIVLFAAIIRGLVAMSGSSSSSTPSTPVYRPPRNLYIPTPPPAYTPPSPGQPYSSPNSYSGAPGAPPVPSRTRPNPFQSDHSNSKNPYARPLTRQPGNPYNPYAPGSIYRQNRNPNDPNAGAPGNPYYPGNPAPPPPGGAPPSPGRRP